MPHIDFNVLNADLWREELERAFPHPPLSDRLNPHRLIELAVEVLDRELQRSTPIRLELLWQKLHGTTKGVISVFDGNVTRLIAVQNIRGALAMIEDIPVTTRIENENALAQVAQAIAIELLELAQDDN